MNFNLEEVLKQIRDNTAEWCRGCDVDAKMCPHEDPDECRENYAKDIENGI